MLSSNTSHLSATGTLELAGLHINVVTYVCLVISIGLLVDFLMHIRKYKAMLLPSKVRFWAQNSSSKPLLNNAQFSDSTNLLAKQERLKS